MSDFQSFNPNGNYGGQDNAQQELGYDPKYDSLSLYARHAVILGIASVAFNFFMPVVLPLAFGSISIILAILSKGKKKKLSLQGRRAVSFALTGLVCHAVILSSSLISTYQTIRNPLQRAQLDAMTSQMYGTTVEEMIRDIDSSLGTNLSGLLFGDTEDAEGSSSSDNQSSDENASSGSDSGSTDDHVLEENTPAASTEEGSFEATESSGDEESHQSDDAAKDTSEDSSGSSTSPDDEPSFIPPGTPTIAAAFFGKEDFL